jgi:hypothetical protein
MAAKGCVAVGVFAWLSMCVVDQGMSTRMQGRSPGAGTGARGATGGTTPFQRESKGQIVRLLAELPDKTFHDKLSGAYDGAVSTHAIGFPVSAPAPTPAIPKAAEDTVLP